MNKKGFTLVELLAVIAILAILVILALPNVLKLFNRATKDTFDTEVKTIIQTVQKQWLSDYIGGKAGSEIVYCRVNGVDCDNSLQLDGDETIDYYVKVDSQGNISQIGVTDDKHQFKSDKKGIKAGDEIISSVIAELPEDQIFQVTKDGLLVNNGILTPTRAKLNRYGYYYDVKYTGKFSEDDIDSKLNVIFKEDGTFRMWIELGEQDYLNHKESNDLDLGCSDYECAKATVNYIFGDKENGLVAKLTTRSNSFVSFYSNDGTTTYDMKFYFSLDGKSFYAMGGGLLSVNPNDIYVENTTNNKPINQYGFYYDVDYVGPYNDDYLDTKFHFTVQENGTVRIWVELSAIDYYKNKEKIDANLGTNTYEEAKAQWNSMFGDAENGLVTNNTTFENSHIIIDTTAMTGEMTDLYFSSDGKAVYFDEDLQIVAGYYNK